MPNEHDEHDVTVLLARVREGDCEAKARLLSLTYDQLRHVAAQMFRHQPGDHTLQPTALVNELCIRMLQSDRASWEDRKHFFRSAAQAMRNLLTDHARAQRSERRGGGGRFATISLGEMDPAAHQTPDAELDLTALDETLTKLSALDSRVVDVFELRFLVGLSVQETARVLEVSPRTVELDTGFLRAWLHKEIAR